MTLLAIVLVLVLEWYFRLPPSYRSFRWFVRFRRFMLRQFPAQFEGIGGLLFMTGTLPLLFALVLWFTPGWPGQLLYLVLGTGLLWYCLGPQDLRAMLAPYFAALERNDNQSAWEHARERVDADATDELPQLGRQVSRFIFTEINSRFIALLFWFAVAGPGACLFYRLCTAYAEILKAEPGHPHQRLNRTVLHVLNWLPARITALAYALVGDFVRGYGALHPFWREADASAERILVDSGLASLAMGPDLPMDALEENTLAMALAERALLLVLVLIALFTLFGVLI